MLYKGNLIEVEKILDDHKILICLNRKVSEYAENKSVDLNHITERK